jgi:hypothetical protein
MSSRSTRIGKRLAVDAVAIIGEHGVSLRTPRGNFQYPRWRYFDQVIRVLREDAQVVPVHKRQILRLRVVRRPRYVRHVMAGSTVHRTWRLPPLELSPRRRLTEALAVSYSETGIESVRYVEAPEVWAMADGDEWSRKLGRGACHARKQLRGGSNHPATGDPCESRSWPRRTACLLRL